MKVHHFQFVHESDRNPPIIQNNQSSELSQYKEISIIYDYIFEIFKQSKSSNISSMSNIKIIKEVYDIPNIVGTLYSTSPCMRMQLSHLSKTCSPPPRSYHRWTISHSIIMRIMSIRKYQPNYHPVVGILFIHI